VNRVSNLHVLQRTAVQCFTLRAFTSLIDCVSLSPIHSDNFCSVSLSCVSFLTLKSSNFCVHHMFILQTNVQLCAWVRHEKIDFENSACMCLSA